jgi:hypothetical protein
MLTEPVATSHQRPTAGAALRHLSTSRRGAASYQHAQASPHQAYGAGQGLPFHAPGSLLALFSESSF